MRIMSISAQKPNSTGSGVYLTELVKGFHKLGIEQAVLAGVYASDHVILPEGISFFPVFFQTEQLPYPIPGMSDEMPYQSTVYSQMTENMLEQYRNAFTEDLKRAVEEFQPDILLCHHLYYLTALVRELFPNRLVWGICHGTDLRQMKKHGMRAEMMRENIQLLDHIFVLHQTQQLEVSAIYGVEESRCTVIGSGFNQEVFLPCEKREPHEDIRLIFAGKIAEKKGVMSLIRALTYLDDPKDRVVLNLAGGAGNKEEYEEILALIKECPCRVNLLGKLSQEELAEEFRKNDIFILPSFYEGLPLVILESLACGLKVIATNLPGVKPWLDLNVKEHGIIFVEPPAMRNADEPEKEELSGFERRLAEAIACAADQKEWKVDVSHLSWDGICRKIISAV